MGNDANGMRPGRMAGPNAGERGAPFEGGGVCGWAVAGLVCGDGGRLVVATRSAAVAGAGAGAGGAAPGDVVVLAPVPAPDDVG